MLDDVVGDRRLHVARAVHPAVRDHVRGVAGDLRASSARSSPTRSAPTRRSPGSGQGSVGSFFIGLGVVALAFPLGIGAAIYLEEYAPRPASDAADHGNDAQSRRRAGRDLRRARLIIFVSWLEFLTRRRARVISAAFTMAVLVLPIVIITSMEAIRAVPQGLRDAGYGVGASQWEVDPRPRAPVRRARHPDRHHALARPGARRGGTAADPRRDHRVCCPRRR